MQGKIKLADGKQSIQTIEDFVDNKKEFEYIGNLTHLFYSDKDKKGRERMYYKMLNFVFDTYNNYKESLTNRRAKVMSIYDLLDYENKLFNKKSKNNPPKALPPHRK